MHTETEKSGTSLFVLDALPFVLLIVRNNLVVQPRIWHEDTVIANKIEPWRRTNAARRSSAIAGGGYTDINIPVYDVGHSATNARMQAQAMCIDTASINRLR
ncbi:hypothetical protein [Nitrosomonas sp. Is37]|uniref:hypothetical protein n=1 Tax=Nitrosomonas sp. Is37 TaxID=3080535 RepID=UPI00294AD920|nr:hypothetical protein [Nitrosomonas sp. Is37]MDV6345611.1 hypothetical protein [Nitrosomonas sp. Is37]